jgi:uncharacterized protein YndB with AHSA1/START domain
MTRTLAPVSRTTFVRCSPQHAFTVFTEQIGGWWPLQSHTVYEGDASSVAFEDGRIVERASDGRTDVWGEVLSWDPPSQLSFSWHPGQPDSERTQVTVAFRAEGDGTRVDLEHVGWEIFGGKADETRAGYANDDGWTAVIDRYASHIP